VSELKLLLTMNLPYFPAHGGANKANRFLAESFAERGNDVTVVAPALGVPSRITIAELLESLAEQGIEAARSADAIVFTMNGVTVHAVTEPNRIRAYLIERLNEDKPDWAVVSSEEPTQNLLNAAVESYSGRVVYLAHTPTFLPFGPQSFYPSRQRTELLERVNGIIAVSRFMQDYIREHSRLEPKMLYLPVYGPGPFPVLGRFDNSYVTLINPCRLKGLDIFAALARALPDVAFAAVPTWGTTPSDLETLRAIENVQILEPSNDIDRIFEQTRVLLMPSLWLECFGLTAVEAQLRSIPVIASDVGGLPEAKLGTDFLIPVTPIESFTNTLDENTIPTAEAPAIDVEPWKNALTTLLQDEETYDRHATAARDHALRFHASVGIGAWERYLLDLPEGHSCVQQKKEPVSVDPKSDALSALSPEQRALLLRQLKKKDPKRAPRNVGQAR
jgi:glycosyltransferase involved in cell wall biosynthesis